MKTSPDFEFPPEQDRAFRKARRLERLTIGYLLSVVILLYFVLGSSQAMKTAWLEDILSLVPPIVFPGRFEDRDPFTQRALSYGYHRAVSIAFLVASVALLLIGGWLLIDAAIKLIKAEHPTIGGVQVFGHTIWLGWLMLPALVWSGVPAVLLGRAKLPLARKIHDKVLHADAKMNKADWLTAAAAFVGVLGISLGYWWADAVAAAFISFEIMRDGYTNLREVVTNLMDEVPKTVERTEIDPLPGRIEERLKQFPWILDAQVRMREEGHVYFGEAFVIVAETAHLLDKLYEATKACAELNWRVHDIVLVPVPSLEENESRSDAG